MKRRKVNFKLTPEAAMLEEIRALLNLTIEEFVFQMEWPNAKYYDYIKNGRIRKNSDVDVRIFAHPTIHKIFTGINKAIDNNLNWKEKSSDITAIVITYLLPSI